MRKSEEQYLKRFLKSAGYNPERIDDGADPPDAVISLNGKRIGMEITEFYSDAPHKGSKGSERQAKQKEWRNLQSEINNELRRKLPSYSLFVLLTFKKPNNELPSRNQYRRFAEEIAETVKKEIAENPKEIRREIHSFPPEFSLIQSYLHCIKLRKSCREDSICDSISHRWGSIGMNQGALISTVEPKIESLNKAGWTGLSEKWLLIISGHELAQQIDPCDELVETKLNSYSELNQKLAGSKFDKVFIHRYNFPAIFIFENNQWRKV